jgi:hypothetical protein
MQKPEKPVFGSPSLDLVTVDGAISRGLVHPDEAVQVAALHFLEAANDAKTLGPIIELAMNSTGNLRTVAMHAISEIARSTAIGATRDKYQTAASQISQPEPFTMTEIAYADLEHYDVCLRAVVALALLGEPSGYAMILGAIRDPHASNLGAALGRVPDFAKFGVIESGKPVDWESPLAAVISNLDQDTFTRQNALVSLKRVNPERAQSVIESVLPHETDKELAEYMKLVASALETRVKLPEPIQPHENPMSPERENADENVAVDDEPRQGNAKSSLVSSMDLDPPKAVNGLSESPILEDESMHWELLLVGIALLFTFGLFLLRRLR